MLREVQNVRQVPGEQPRRWFEDDRFDLILWLDAAGAIVGVQLCYDKDVGKERALTWRKGRGFSHQRVDDGEHQPGTFKMTPILVADDIADVGNLLRNFLAASQELEPAIVAAVVDIIKRYSDAGAR